MLEQSILGKLYNFWVDSRAFLLLQHLYRAVLRLLDGSAILHGLFAEGRLERAYRDSLLCRMIRGWIALLLKVLSWFQGLCTAAEGSLVIRVLRGSVLRYICSFEGLLGAFALGMFILPHDSWNNLYAVLAAAVFLLLYLLLAAAGRRKFLPPETLGLGSALFVLALVLSMGFSSAPRDSLRILLFFFASLALCYVAAADLREPERLRRLLAFLYIALLAVSFFGVIQHAFDLVKESTSFTDLNLNKGLPGRVYSTLDNPINLSEFILLFLPLGAAFAAGAKRPMIRVLLALGLVIPALALVYTYSRGGWIAIVLAAAVFTFCCNKRLIPALIVLGLLLIPVLPKSVLLRISTIGSRKDSSTQHRLDIWKGVLRMLSDYDRVLTGIGLGPVSFRMVYPFYSLGTAKQGAYHTQLHYLELVTEMGILGLVSFLYMMCKYLGRAARAIRSSLRECRLVLIACISSLVGLAFVGLVEYVWFYPRIMFGFFLFLGILLAAAAPEGENV